MEKEPIEVESIAQEESCDECGKPAGIFPICKACDYAWLERMRKENGR